MGAPIMSRNGSLASSGDGGRLESMAIMAPTPKNWVASYWRTRSQVVAGWKAESRALDRPEVSEPSTTNMDPLMWNSGTAAYMTSSAVVPYRSLRTVAQVQRECWVSSAPFDGPVVPDLYITGAGPFPASGGPPPTPARPPTPTRAALT